MKNLIQLDKSKKVFPIITLILGAVIFAVQLITRSNLLTLVSAIYCAVMSAIILLYLIIKKKVYPAMIFGYAFSSLGMIIFHVIWGADAGFGALSNGLAGFSSAEHPLLTGEGSFFTRLLGNLILVLPVALALWGLFFVAGKVFKSDVKKKVSCAALSLLLVLTSITYILTMNMRTKPVAKRLWEGQEDYLGGIDKKADSDSPNVLVVLLDDMGYGDVSLNGAIYDTPNIDSIGENGLNFDNFYSSYSVCSPARFACLTGRYPYRGYADNVIYPTVSTFSPFASTRVFNSYEMGGNVDGMLGDEITMAEVFKSAGYATGAFGKWHLGDYGEYLPTNQGFDYFYGSHYVNDMTPFYHVKEKGGEYEIVHGTDELKDQSKATEWINEEMNDWITNTVKNSSEPFFVYYASPWPHAPVYAGDDFDGVSGMGTYVDCVTEVDAYLGKLFNTLEELGELENTIIVFTSDNGPALEGSTGELRGGKYLAYEGGQKVPFMIRWDNNGGLFKSGDTRSQSATLVDLFPTLIDLCGITGENGKESYLPSDRKIDGVSMLPLIEKDSVIHSADTPILHMKREKLKAIQYTVPTAEIKSREEYAAYDYDILNEKYITFKYFDRIQNDNSAFFDKYRKNWLHILTDDAGENYNRTTVYPTVAEEMNAKMKEIMKDFKNNRRGIIE